MFIRDKSGRETACKETAILGLEALESPFSMAVSIVLLKAFFLAGALLSLYDGSSGKAAVNGNIAT